MNNESELLGFAHEEFGELTEAEEKLFKAVANGELADYSTESDEDNDSAKAENWGPKRVLKADRIAWLCTDPRASALVTYQGIQVRGARIDGELVLRFTRIPFMLYFSTCALVGGIDLAHAELPMLILPRSRVASIFADGLTVYGSVLMRDGFRSEGEVSLRGAKIGGIIDCRASTFTNPKAIALDLIDARVEGSVLLNEGLRAEGEVRLVGSRISGYLDCRRAHFFNPKSKALSADGLRVTGSVLMGDGFRAEGEVRLPNANIGGKLYCSGGQFINPERWALKADMVNVDGGVYLRKGFLAEGEVVLVGGSIEGSLDCSGSTFLNAGKRALNGDRLRVRDHVLLRGGFRATGCIDLLGACVGGNLEFDGSQLANPKQVAINADIINVAGSVFLRNGFVADGEVRLLSAVIGGDLDCKGGHFANRGSGALVADNARISGNVSLRGGFWAEGEVRLLGATINGNLQCDQGKFENPHGDALCAQAMHVKGSVHLSDKLHINGVCDFAFADIGNSFILKDVTSPSDMKLNLRYARIGLLWDEKASWPEAGKLFLEGLDYGEICHEVLTDPKTRIEWLRRQPSERFAPQPYEQLAKVFRKCGREKDAREVLITKNKDRAKQAQLSFFEKLRQLILRYTIGYGYRPFRALWWMVMFVGIGFLGFSYGFQEGIILPTQEGTYVSDSAGVAITLTVDYPRFNALVYSLDMFVPLVDLHQESYWIPNGSKGKTLFGISWLRSGPLINSYHWVHICFGWLLMTLFVAGLSGLVKK